MTKVWAILNTFRLIARLSSAETSVHLQTSDDIRVGRQSSLNFKLILKSFKQRVHLTKIYVHYVCYVTHSIKMFANQKWFSAKIEKTSHSKKTLWPLVGIRSPESKDFNKFYDHLLPLVHLSRCTLFELFLCRTTGNIQLNFKY